MSNKIVENLAVDVDDLTLSLIGWQVEEVQARLVTTSYGKGENFQEIAVSGTVRFLPEDWSERFSEDKYAVSPVLRLKHRDSDIPPNHREILLTTIKKASKRPMRFTAQSDPWESRVPCRAADLQLALTGYDEAASNPDVVNGNLELPHRKASPIPVEVIDETSSKAIQLDLSSVAAYIGSDSGEPDVRVTIEGSVAFGTAEELLVDYLSDDGDWLETEAGLDEACPFIVKTPRLEIQILDETGFLLDQRSIYFDTTIPVDENSKPPTRRPRWLAQTATQLRECAGTPTRAVVRMIDP